MHSPIVITLIAGFVCNHNEFVGIYAFNEKMIYFCYTFCSLTKKGIPKNFNYSSIVWFTQRIWILYYYHSIVIEDHMTMLLVDLSGLAFAFIK